MGKSSIIKELTEEEFKRTFSSQMTDVTDTAEAIIDIWEYVESLVRYDIVDKYVLENCLVEKVYRNSTSTFDHILLPTNILNVFIIVVVDLKNKVLIDHTKLDLNGKYGSIIISSQ